MVHATCAALHCLSSSYTDKDLKFHQFPHDVERRNIWITACKRSDVIDKDWDFFKHKYVCGLHFQKCMYSKNDRLKKSAIPSLHLSEKPLQHNSSTQTVVSIQYVDQQSEKDRSMLYVMPNVEKSSTTTYTQTENSLPYDIKHVNIKEEIITHPKIEDSASVEQDVEIKTINDDDHDDDDDDDDDDENSDSKAFEDPINTSIIKMDGSVQTDRVIVLSHNADGNEGSINPEECSCNRNDYVDLTRSQFYRICSKFLSPNFATTVKIQINLDHLTKQGGNKLSKASSLGSVKTGVADCVEDTAAERGGVVTPDVAVPGTLSEKPLKHDSYTQTVQSIQYVDQQSENDGSILYVMPNVEKISTTTYTQTENSLPYNINHVKIKEETITHTKIQNSESVEQDVEIKTENDDDDDENSVSEAFEEDVKMKIEIVENEILPLVQSTQFLQSVALETMKDDGTLQAKNLLQEIDQGLKATTVNRTESSVSTYPINTSTMPILKRKIDGSIQTDRVIVLSRNADGSERSINPEECSCKRNDYFGLTRLQFERACSKFLSANFAIAVKKQMHLEDAKKYDGNKLSEAGSVKAGAAECVELNAAGCGEVVAPDVVIAGTKTADSAVADLHAVDGVKASAADCARSSRDNPSIVDRGGPSRRGGGGPSRRRGGGPSPRGGGGPSRRGGGGPSRRGGCANLRDPHKRPGLRTIDDTPLTDLGKNRKSEDPILITSAVELTNTSKASIRPKKELKRRVRVGPLERTAAGDLNKDWVVKGNAHCDHVTQGGSELSPPGSLQGIPRSCRTPVSTVNSGVIRKRKRKKKILVTAPVAEGSEFDSDIDDEFDMDKITSSGDVTVNIPDDDDLDESVSKIVNSIERAMDDAIDHLVGVPSDFNWRADFDTFQGIPEKFSGPTPGPIEDYDTPYDAFTAIWSNDIIERIVVETNKYAKQLIDEKTIAGTLKPSSRLRYWTNTDKDEIYTFFAMHILMGLDQRKKQQEFWSPGYLEMPRFRKLMKYRRFLLLIRCIHFEDNSGASQDLPQSGGTVLPAKMRKIAPIVGHLNNKFSNLYNLHADIAIDESLTKGRSSWVQSLRSKTGWDGIKSYEVCDSSTGYLYKFEIYTGKNIKQGHYACLSAALAQKSTQVVMDLLTGLETRGHCITMDNFYNSPALARHLKSLGFDCLGTMRPNRKNVPLEIKNVPKNVAKGTTIARHSGDVSCIAWKDTKMVTMISTYHTTETYIDRKTGRELVKPVVIRDYNNIMIGVNLKDQKLSKYFFERKRIKRCLKWYIKIFIRLLNVSVRNAFILLSGSLNRRGMPFRTDRDFREELANSLLANRRLSPEEILAPIEVKYTRLRKDILHVPKYHTNDADRWRCYMCHRKGIQKIVHSSCVTCNEFICFEGCWSEWHSLQKLPKPDNNVSGQKRKHSA